MDTPSRTPIIYNLFPLLAGTMPEWLPHARRAAAMGFNWLFINPIYSPGFSSSLYAVRDYYRINPLFVPPDEPDAFRILRQTLHQFQSMGLRVMTDLVINHTSRDCPLVREHPEWYVRDETGEPLRPFARDPHSPAGKTVWGDLAVIDNQNSADKAGLWNYWANVVKHYLLLGFDGFRCDAAYKVPSELWRYLIREADKVNPEALFFAEIMGSMEEEALALHDANFDYIFNSSKWWDFEQAWALDQQCKFLHIAPSISFPETHDTPRLAAECSGNEAVPRQRYAFAAVFSAGVMLPIGYEFGFKKRLSVVDTRPADWETSSFDLQIFIKNINKLKLNHPLLQTEGSINRIDKPGDVLMLQRQSSLAPEKTAFIIINKKVDANSEVKLDNIELRPEHRLYRICRDDVPVTPVPAVLQLGPAEVALVLEEAA